jgi:endo-1,3(4)-beta-glucanase
MLDIFTTNSRGSYSPIFNDEEKEERNSVTPFRCGVIISIIALGLCIIMKKQTDIEQSEVSGFTFQSVHHTESPTPLWGSVSKPYPTGAFWTNFAVLKGDNPVGVYPYGVKCLSEGVQVSYGAWRRIVTDESISDPFVADLVLSSKEAYISHSVHKYDDISVTMKYDLDGKSSMEAPLVKGSPFITMLYNGATPLISSDLMLFLSVEQISIDSIGQGLKSSMSLLSLVGVNSTYSRPPGTLYMASLGNFQKWLIYCSDPAPLVLSGNTLTGSAKFTGIVRVAFLPAQQVDSALAVLVAHVSRYPTGGLASSLGLSDSTAGISLKFQATGTGNLLMLALPHHVALMGAKPRLLRRRRRLSERAQLEYGPIYCIKGRMTPTVGDSWELVYDMPAVTWHYASATDTQKDIQKDTQTDAQTQTQTHNDSPKATVGAIVKALHADLRLGVEDAVDPYTFGKQVSRLGRLALSAEEVGSTKLQDAFLDKLELALIPWATGKNTDALLYDATWGGIVPSIGLADKYADFGSGWYSDHHFHYGYIIYAAAVWAKLRPKSFAPFKVNFDALVRDICSINRADAFFPYVRHKDFYDGHSWASGLFNQANGKGQESSSEAVNAYYAVTLYAMANSMASLRAQASLFLAMEVASTKAYWHITPSKTGYDPFFSSKLMVGNMGALDVTTTTWFGTELQYVHGIQILPVTPITAALFDQKFVLVEWPLLSQMLPTFAPGLPLLPVPPHTPSPGNNDSTGGVPAAPEKPPAVSPVPGDQCEAHTRCIAFGLTGRCCPALDGTMLECCGSASPPAVPVADTIPKATTSSRNLGAFATVSDEWVSYLVAVQAVLDSDRALLEFNKLTDFGPGGALGNSLLWASTRPQPTVRPGSLHTDPGILKTHTLRKCASNSACDITGLQGNCCPGDNGVSLGCCPKKASTLSWRL